MRLRRPVDAPQRHEGGGLRREPLVVLEQERAQVAEVEQAGFEVGEFPNSDWSVVFKIIDSLLTDERFTKDNLRFVVWSNW
jgi:hypothetical protein